MTLVYRVFKPGYVFHELSHYLVGSLLAERASFGVDPDGRPWVDVEFTAGVPLWRAIAVGVAPVISGLVFLTCYMWAYLGPLADLSGVFGLAVHLYMLGMGVVWTSPSPEDLTPLWVAVGPRRPPDVPEHAAADGSGDD